jgi:16S rRNA (uracil1498-N3)-methyltransferase
MQKYFVLPTQVDPPHIFINGDDAYHMQNVMRLRTGSEVICSDGQGNDYLVEIVSISAKEVLTQIRSAFNENREPKVRVWIAQALPKSDKMEWIIQKGTEIGAVRFIPFTSRRTIVQLDAKKESKRMERWTKIAKEAAEQAHRSMIPTIDPITDWKKLVHLQEQADLALIAYEGESESGQMIGDAVRRWKDDHGAKGSVNIECPTIVVAIGPEGGFHEEEVSFAKEAGWIPVGLGKRILRTETAGMVALTVIQAFYGEMGG